MVDKEIFINGAKLDQMGESSYDLDQPSDSGNYDARVSELNRKIESLESKKLRMVKFNSKSKERIKKLSLEIEELRNDNALKKEKLKEMEKEIEWSGEELKTLELVAKRKVELETEVSSNMISSMSKGDEANREVSELKRACYGIRGERERERER